MRNKVSLIGRLGANPEIVKFESGNKVARMHLATNEPYKDKTGEWVNQTQWHNIFAWGSLADLIERKLSKGSEIVVEGRLVNKSFETKTGEKRQVTEIEASGFLLLSQKPSK
jgi:single-strand DNA-binding protein